MHLPQRTRTLRKIKMKRPSFGSKTPQFKTQLALASLPVALLLARGLLGNSPISAWSQNNDPVVPSGRVEPSSAEPASLLPVAGSAALPPLGLPPLESAAPPVPEQFRNPEPLTLPMLDRVTPPASDLPSGDAGNEPRNPPGTLLIVGPEMGQNESGRQSDNSVGIYSPLYEGGGFNRSVFTPAYLPTSQQFGAPDPQRYRSLFGIPSLGTQFNVNLAVEFNDNINLGDRGNRESDLIVTPAGGMGLRWQPGSNTNQVIELNLGVGYRAYLNHSELNSLIITPSTHAEYKFGVGPVKLNLHDFFNTEIDPVSQGQIGATSVNPNQLLNYRRIQNTLGLGAEWSPYSNIALNAGYDYKIDRSLTEQFRSLDHDEHIFSGGVSYTVSDRLSFGFGGNYTLVDYTRDLQNDGAIWTFGPSVRYKIRPNLIFSGAVGYASSSFDRPTLTSIQDSSNYRSVTYQASIRHNFRTNLGHELAVARGASLGIGNNFAAYTSLQYGIYYGQTDSKLRAQGTFTWENFKVSGLGGENANRYLLYLGVRYQLTRSLSTGLGYSYVLKDSDRAGLDYYQNRIILDATYQF